MLEVVSNSGPIMHLSEIDKIELFGAFSKINVPLLVYTEVKRELKLLNNLKIVNVPKEEILVIKDKIKHFALDEPELHALYLANKLNLTFLTDDLEAREAGKKLGIDVHGSIGIISLAYKEGIIDLPNAKKAINQLYEKSSLFVAKAIIDLAIDELTK